MLTLHECQAREAVKKVAAECGSSCARVALTGRLFFFSESLVLHRSDLVRCPYLRQVNDMCSCNSISCMFIYIYIRDIDIRDIDIRDIDIRDIDRVVEKQRKITFYNELEFLL
jgi:hypothetical protein